MINEDSSEIPVTPDNLRIFMENNEKVNKHIATNIPDRISGRLICTDCIIANKVDDMYTISATAHHLTVPTFLIRSWC